MGLRLKKPLERVLRAGHPWVYRDALAGEVAPGTWTRLDDRKGAPLGWGLAEAGPIGMRVWSLRETAFEECLEARIRSALQLRTQVPLGDTNAHRLIHGEGDRLPGVVVDRYDEVAVLRLDGDAIRTHEATLVEGLRPHLDALGIETLLVRQPRGSEEKVALAYGTMPDAVRVVREHGMVLRVDLRRGQKTGLFLDHRESRRRVRQLAEGKRVLNLYAYTGGFSVAAGLGGAARVTTVDVAAGAIALAAESFADNGLEQPHRTLAEDVPRFLASERQRYDLVVADPPSFAPKRDAVPKAMESYAKLHAACLERLSQGGLYLAASCSSHVDGERFAETLAKGAHRARVVLQVLARWGAPPDHPRLLAFPEGDYLECVLCRAL